MNTYDIGDLVRLSAAFAVGGAATDPTSLTFKLKTPSGAVTTYVYGVDAELVHDSTGNYHVDYAPADDGTYWFRFAGAGGATDAEELSFEVRPSELEDGTPVTPPTTTMLNVPAGGSVGDVLVWDGLAWAAVAGKHVTADQRAAADAANGPDAGNALATMDDVQSARATVIDNAGDVTGNYATVGAALAAITDAASTKRYVIALRGKTTETADVTWKRYVNLVGDSDGHAEMSGGYSLLLAGGGVDDQSISGVTVSMALGTSAVSAQMTFSNCALTGGLVQSHSCTIFVNDCKFTGQLNTGTATSGTIEFRDSTVDIYTDWSCKTLLFKNCTVTVFVALTGSSSVTLYRSLMTLGSMTTPSGSTLTLYQSVLTISSLAVFQIGGALYAYASQISGNVVDAQFLYANAASTVVIANSAVVSRGTSGKALLVNNGSGDPTLFVVACSYLYAEDGPLDSAGAYTANVFLCTLKGAAPGTLTCAAGTALGSNIRF